MQPLISTVAREPTGWRWLLAGLLVLVMGSGAVAQEATPVPSPWYAPDDLESALPPTVAGIEMEATVLEVDTPAMASLHEDRWQDVLVPLGKDTMDVRMAWAMDDVQDVYVSIRMYVIDGVATTGVAEGVWRAQQILWMAYSDDEWDWKRIAGRRVAEVTFRAEDEGHVPEATEYVYPLGEVVFVVFTDAVEGIEPVPIEDVLAELPWMTDLEAAWVAVHDNTPEGW